MASSLGSRAEPASEPEIDLETAERVASVRRAPRRILPRGPAREALIAIAAAGYDCYAYASGGAVIGTWCAWFGPLADARRPERNGRVTLAEWHARWREMVAEMGLRDVVGLERDDGTSQDGSAKGSREMPSKDL